MSSRKHPLGTVAELDDQALEEFARAFEGEVLLPDAEGYDDARTVWNGLINKYPAIIARVADANDVAQAIEFSRTTGLPLSIRSGAHHQTGSAIAEQGLVIDLATLDRVEVDPDAKRVTVGPSAHVEDVLGETQPHGLAPPTGSAGSTGIGGSTLGAGIGWIRRKHGLGIDALRRLELVTADGEQRTVSPDQHADLFWALRGGGGNFGVVTAFEFDLYEVGPMIQGLGVFYPFEAAADVLATHRDRMETAPDELTTLLICGTLPNLPPIPDDLAGTDAVGILGCYAGDPETGAEVIEPLRTVAEPLMDMSDVMPYEMLHDLGTQLYPWGRKYTHRSVYFDRLTDDVHEYLIERIQEAPVPMAGLGVWPLGGRIGESADAAYPWTDKRVLVTIEGNWEAFETQPTLDWAATVDRELRQRGGEGTYSGFTGVDEREWEDWPAQVYGDSYDRLAEIKATYDPDNVFGEAVNIAPL